ncbi:hypothetical protein CXG81DRAFT_3375, partial [Caulochytrium protostelioides]
INIRRDVSDRFYRYKMPSLLCKIEGKGNGIKTVIPNMSDIAKSLARPPAYPTKFFGCELGAQIKCDAAADRYIVNGAHDAQKLQQLLDGFITKFVLCNDCSNPETDLIITKDETIYKDCKACGAKKPCDMRHKLCTFILRNPPGGGESSAKERRKDKKDRRAAKSGTQSPKAASIADADDAAQDALTRRIQAEAAALEPVEIEEDDDWADDTSPEAVAKRMATLALSAKVSRALNKKDSVDDEDDEDDPLEELASYITEQGRACPDDAILDKIDELEIRSDRACTVLVQVLFDEKIIEENQIEQRAELFQALVEGNEKAQKATLGGVERLVGMSVPQLMPKLPLILKAFYDIDVIEEDTLMAWEAKVSKRYVDKKIGKELREKAAPFLTWLREAEEEDSDED